MFNEPKPLLVVYKEKDEMILNQLKALVDTKDDGADGTIVGTEDGTVSIVAWSEQVWLQNKKAGNTGDLADKILFIGDIKGTEKLAPILNIMFDEHGIKYGFAGNQALITINTKSLYQLDQYECFMNDFRKVTDLAIARKEKKIKGWTQRAKVLIPYVGPILTSKALIEDSKLVREQMLFYGITKLYLNDLDSFMKA